eukprot:gene24192-29261_t
MNESRRIAKCIESAKFADQIVVVDSGSKDDTVLIAQSLGAQVHIHTDWKGFAEQRNRLLQYCSSDYIFFLDADEVITPELEKEIQTAVSSGLNGVWEILWLQIAYGKPLKYMKATGVDLCAAHRDFSSVFLSRLSVFSERVIWDLGQALVKMGHRVSYLVPQGSECHFGQIIPIQEDLDWQNQIPEDVDIVHFQFNPGLGKAAWSVKNVQGAIDSSLQANAPLIVMGGDRLNIKRGFRFTWSRKINFLGMVGGETKFSVLRKSRGLIFPVRWHEPFGLAAIESLYFGCPVFATPYGALPELVPTECGTLSIKMSDLVDAMKNQSFNREVCHLHAANNFNAEKMAASYFHIYQR